MPESILRVHEVNVGEVRVCCVATSALSQRKSVAQGGINRGGGGGGDRDETKTETETEREMETEDRDRYVMSSRSVGVRSHISELIMSHGRWTHSLLVSPKCTCMAY